jgi:hypothetical protein
MLLGAHFGIWTALVEVGVGRWLPQIQHHPLLRVARAWIRLKYLLLNSVYTESARMFAYNASVRYNFCGARAHVSLVLWAAAGWRASHSGEHLSFPHLWWCHFQFCVRMQENRPIKTSYTLVHFVWNGSLKEENWEGFLSECWNMDKNFTMWTTWCTSVSSAGWIPHAIQI